MLSGLAVLDISKTLMYDYHYNVMKRHYGEKISLMYTDTGELILYFKTNLISTNKLMFIDSLVYFIETDDFYEDMANNAILLDRMDTSNLPRDRPCFIAERKKIPGLFSDETNGDIMTEFCALRSKSYSYKINGIDSTKEEIRAKGIRVHVVRNHMTFEDHRRCLFEGMNSVVNRRPNISIRSFNHQLTTIRTNKIIYIFLYVIKIIYDNS
ncbi:unnamed protein product [Aphis gossypii]|uniref:Uncharacterized protein n=1 Tax=Aphis gossypii TaxID=80765 RepID=A0A9P0NLP6_APHGO|nr:unnamed protein product [Aphis gossypii]